MTNNTEGAPLAVILAAGKGTRMRSEQPKVMARLLGEPMLGWVLRALEPLFGDNLLIVAGHRAEIVQREWPKARFVIQEKQLGTGNAAACAMGKARELAASSLLIVNGDAPLITTAIIADFMKKAAAVDLAFATITLPEPGAYGRVWRKDGKPLAIVEAKDYDERIHGPASGEVNAGLYLIRLSVCETLLPKLGNANKSGEYYLTDLVALARQAGYEVAAVECGNAPELLGVNSPLELAQSEAILKNRVNSALLNSGVIIHEPQALRAGPNVIIEPGVEITAPCEIYGNSRIAAGAKIASHCVIEDSEIGSNAQISSFSHLVGARVGDSAKVGPYGRLRPGAVLEPEAHVGNFVELKNARLGCGAKANHLSYLGDAEIGARVNIGAGTITCNYDGQNKHRTSIGEAAFIGSNTALVAPVSIGAGALVGAGSTITKDVPENELGIARSRQKNIPRRKK